MRGKAARLEHLRAVPMLRAFTKKELELVDRLAEVLDVKAGQALVTEGERGHEFFVIADGKAEVTRGGSTVATLGPGDHFGELAVLDPQPRTASVTMASDGQVMILTEREFYRMLQEAPTLSRKLLIGLARRLHEVDAAVIR